MPEKRLKTEFLLFVILFLGAIKIVDVAFESPACTPLEVLGEGKHANWESLGAWIYKKTRKGRERDLGALSVSSWDLNYLFYIAHDGITHYAAWLKKKNKFFSHNSLQEAQKIFYPAMMGWLRSNEALECVVAKELISIKEKLSPSEFAAKDKIIRVREIQNAMNRLKQKSNPDQLKDFLNYYKAKSR